MGSLLRVILGLLFTVVSISVSTLLAYLAWRLHLLELPPWAMVPQLALTIASFACFISNPPAWAWLFENELPEAWVRWLEEQIKGTPVRGSDGGGQR